MRLYSPPYLNERLTLARYATTFPSSTFISNFEISAIRRSLRLFAAVSTARLAASSQKESLTLTLNQTRSSNHKIMIRRERGEKLFFKDKLLPAAQDPTFRHKIFP